MSKPEEKLVSQLMTDASNEKLKVFAGQLGTDTAMRKQFLDNPAAVLKQFGMSVDPNVKLDKKQRAMVELFADPKVSELYASGDIGALREHIAMRYQELMGGKLGEVAGFAVADFDVAIEVEAVAVAVVAVAAVVVGATDPSAKVRQIEANTSILSAKIAALEAKMQILERLETKITSLERRVR